MLTLFHHPLSAHSRFVRLVFYEYGEDIHLIEELPWARRPEFLAVNPANTLPVLLAEGDQPIVGAQIIGEYLDETRGIMKREKRLLPEDLVMRAETRRLVDWYLSKFDHEVTRHLVNERAYKLLMSPSQGGGAPNTTIMRAARQNIGEHLKYTNWLVASRNWLGSGAIGYSDLAAAASISVLDYLGEIDWTGYPAARDWYQRMKSRPSFRPLLADRLRGLQPAAHYADLDF